MPCHDQVAIKPGKTTEEIRQLVHDTRLAKAVPLDVFALDLTASPMAISSIAAYFGPCCLPRLPI
jgi:hypothetical protein